MKADVIYTVTVRIMMIALGLTLAWAAFEVATLVLRILCWVWVAFFAFNLAYHDTGTTKGTEQ